MRHPAFNAQVLWPIVVAALWCTNGCYGLKGSEFISRSADASSLATGPRTSQMDQRMSAEKQNEAKADIRSRYFTNSVPGPTRVRSQFADGTCIVPKDSIIIVQDRPLAYPLSPLGLLGRLGGIIIVLGNF